VSSNSCNIDIGLRKKINKEHTQKTTLKKKVHKNVNVYHNECKINLTENYSRTMFPSRFTAKKPTKNIGEEKSTNTENQKHPPVPSITTLFNLLALHNKQLYLKSVYRSSCYV
jgi:hypothetical protein